MGGGNGLEKGLPAAADVILTSPEGKSLGERG